MAVKTMDDIEREQHNKDRDKMKKEVVQDVNEIISNINIFKKPARRKKTFLDWIFFVLKIIGILILIMIVINLFLGNIWLLRFFIKSLFGIG